MIMRVYGYPKNRCTCIYCGPDKKLKNYKKKERQNAKKEIKRETVSVDKKDGDV